MKLLLLYLLVLKIIENKCFVGIYDESRTKLITTVRDKDENCYNMDQLRRIFIERNNINDDKLKLFEVKPYSNQKFYCIDGYNCAIAINGFGLEPKDIYAVIPVESNCGDPDVNIYKISEINTYISTKLELMNETELIMPVTKKSLIANFEMNTDHNEYKVCYLPREAYFYDKNFSLNVLTSEHIPLEAGLLTFTNDTIYKCDFEGKKLSSCGLTIYKPRSDLDFVWKIDHGESTTPGSGPKRDHTYEKTSPESTNVETYDAIGDKPIGHYAIMKSAGYLGTNVQAIFFGPPLSGPAGKYCVKFYYYMYGKDVNTLRIYTFDNKIQNVTDEGSESVNTNNWGQLEWSAIGNKGAQWNEGGFTINIEENKTKSFVIEGLSGNSELGDIAIDDISVKYGSCERIQNPKTISEGRSNMICGEVRMITGKHPEDKSWNIEGAINCNGRGYTKAEFANNWVPCCIPSFGKYNMLLSDSMNDGWENSRLELRFFDKLYVYGKELTEHSGDVSVPITIGQLEILEAMYIDEEIHIRVRLVHPNSKLYCGIAEAEENGKIHLPTPTANLIKLYGVESNTITHAANEILTITVKGDFIQQNLNYDIYCYAELEHEETDGDTTYAEISNYEQMTDEEVAATRYRISTDTTYPLVSLLSINVDTSKVEAKVISNEDAKIWILPVMSNTLDDIDEDYIKLKGEFNELLANKELTIEFNNLFGNFEYVLYCFVEDYASPKVNKISQDMLRAGGFANKNTVNKFKTKKRVPKATIKRISTKAKGFDITVSVDEPGIVYCAAGGNGVEFPSVNEVIKYGVKKKVTLDQFANMKQIELNMEIRGIETQQQYKIFCASTTEDGTLQNNEKDMWKNSIKATSYGKFCDVPVNPPIANRSTNHTPFDPITSDEEIMIKKFIINGDDFDVNVLYRIDLFANKTEIYDYYENDGPFPERYARVRLGRCINNRGFYEQLKVGPLNKTANMTWTRLSHPKETQCAGYSSEGVFGRRLNENNSTLRKAQIAFMKLFNANFGSKECLQQYSNETKFNCLKLGMITFDGGANDTVDSSIDSNTRIWVGLRYPNGTNTNFYFELNGNELANSENIANTYSLKQIHNLLDQYNWYYFNGPVYYKNYRYNTLNEFINNVELFSHNMDENVPKDNIYALHDIKLHSKRALAPAPFPGAAGTAGVDLDRTTKREGLEYRVPPEHVEAGGKRYRIYSHAGGESYTIDYAGWSFVVTNDRDKALQMWNVKFKNERILFNIGLQEAMAHYTVAERTFFFMDSWYGGLGNSARPVLRGYECPKTGTLVFYDQSLCVFEKEEGRPIRSHYRAGEIRDAASHYTLNLRQMVTVSNYDYLVTYTFHPSGHIEASVAFTGELYAGVEVPWYSSRQAPYGNQVTGAMRMAALHAHLVVWKFDFDLEDYNNNSVFFEEVVPDPNRPGANYIKRYFPSGEKEAAIKVEDSRTIGYSIVNENKKTYGNYAGWRILPYTSWGPYRLQNDLYEGTGAWSKYKAFTTVHKYSELDATLPRDNKFASDPAVSIQNYIDDNEATRHTDLVTWVTMSFMHIPSAEDYPLTVPIGNTLSTIVRPFNWYLEDPTMDLHNAISGDFKDPGHCAVVRSSIFDAMDTKHLHGPIIV